MTIRIDGTDGITNATWTTATRPSSPSVGQTGFNTTLGSAEYWDGSAWVPDKDGTWTAYTPTLSATTGTLTNATVTARFASVGKVYHVNFQIVIVDNGSATGSLVMTTPVTSVAGLFHGIGRNSGTAHAVLVTRLNTTQVYMQKLIDGTYPGSNGHTISGSFTFEGA